jgi:hypothetical protein
VQMFGVSRQAAKGLSCLNIAVGLATRALTKSRRDPGARWQTTLTLAA